MSKALTVLLVDDDKPMRLLMRSMLTKIGFEVIAEGEDGVEGVNLYRQHQPDLMLLDINMPNMDGKEALNQVIQEFPQAMVIMLTSLSDLATVETCIENGAANYIRKDFEKAEIQQRIQETWDAYSDE